MGIWESIQNPLRAEGILSSRVRWPGKKTIQLAPCFSAPAWTTRKIKGVLQNFREMVGNPKALYFQIFCVSSTAVGFRELWWWFMTCSMLAGASLVFTFASWVDQGEEFTEFTHKPSRFHRWRRQFSRSTLAQSHKDLSQMLCFRCFNPQWGLFGWNEWKSWGERLHSTVLTVVFWVRFC